jgi:hypothetical protein
MLSIQATSINLSNNDCRVGQARLTDRCLRF